MARTRIILAVFIVTLAITGVAAAMYAQYLWQHMPYVAEDLPLEAPSAPKQIATHTIVAAGDIVCDEAQPTTPATCQDAATATLVQSLKPEAVLALGDLQYPSGTPSGFKASYDKTWGAFKPITRPVPGNHEYVTANAAGYYDYFGAAAGERGKGYYSFDIGTWHLIALNSELPVNEGSTQRQWLKYDLQQHANVCTLAYWHQPRFSTGYHPSNAAYQGLWQDLYDAHADIVLNGHSHGYERFVPQNPAGVADAKGITEFVVGTGGASWEALRDAVPTLAARQATSFGVLKLDLAPGHADYSFQAIPGAPAYHDSGTVQCQ